MAWLEEFVSSIAALSHEFEHIEGGDVFESACCDEIVPRLLAPVSSKLGAKTRWVKVRIGIDSHAPAQRASNSSGGRS